MSINLGRAIYSLRPNCEFTLKNHDYSTIEWIALEGDAPTAEEVETEMTKIEAQDAAQKAAEEAIRQSKIAKLLALGLTEEEINA